MIKQIGVEIMIALASKGYVLFAPRTDQGLKYDYPDLRDDPSYSNLSKYDMLFVWAMACASSPFADIEGSIERKEACIQYAYPREQRDQKSKTFRTTLPEGVKRGITQMEKYSLAARVSDYVLMKQIRDNISSILSVDISGATGEEKESYLAQAKTAQAILADQRKRIEGLDIGISEESDTKIHEARDVRELYMQQK